MKIFFIVFQIIVAIILAGLILLQSEGGGIGKLYGGLGGKESYHSKKGVEKAVFWGTVGMAALFLITSLVNAFLP